MTETFVAIIAMMVALFVAFGTAVVMSCRFHSMAGLAKRTGFVELRSGPEPIDRPTPEAALLSASARTERDRSALTSAGNRRLLIRRRHSHRSHPWTRALFILR